ncbi:hypothetical protein FOZ63_024065, partial [Perkinsus olseni]
DPQQGSLLYVSEHTPEGEFSLLSPVPTETGSPPQLPVSKTSETFVRQGIPAQAAYQVQYNNSGPPVKSPSPTLPLRPRVEHPSVAQHCSPGDVSCHQARQQPAQVNALFQQFCDFMASHNASSAFPMNPTATDIEQQPAASIIDLPTPPAPAPTVTNITP